MDIDLDFFLDSIKNNKNSFSTERLSSKYYKTWKKKNVINFLDNNCGLQNKRVCGKYFEHHHEVFLFLRTILKNEDAIIIDHIDAHADLGLMFGNFSTDEFISTELLNYPIEKRPNLINVTGEETDLSPGNFLLFAIACGWIKQLNYIHPPGKGTDVGWFIFKEFNPNSNVLQLKKLTKKEFNFVLNNDTAEFAKNINPNNLENEVPIQRISSKNFVSNIDYDYIFLTKSPGFTTKESDKLIPLILEYFDTCNAI
ncbi:MAG: hypothetical protein HND52_10210 [Ignavibacteriae bacterium]|nr:hypothetical protein [Ignavibacteriota bacterium]